jgi:predicted secreted protein
MKGALVFLIVFILVTLFCLAVQDIPPGQQIYDALGAEETESQVLGIGATTLVVAVFNGVVYGVIVWLIYSLTLGRKKKVVEKGTNG